MLGWGDIVGLFDIEFKFIVKLFLESIEFLDIVGV